MHSGTKIVGICEIKCLRDDFSDLHASQDVDDVHDIRIQVLVLHSLIQLLANLAQLERFRKFLSLHSQSIFSELPCLMVDFVNGLLAVSQSILVIHHITCYDRLGIIFQYKFRTLFSGPV